MNVLSHLQRGISPAGRSAGAAGRDCNAADRDTVASGWLYFDDPPPGASATLLGIPGVDYFDTTEETIGAYRGDGVDMGDGTDVARQKFTDAGVTPIPFKCCSILKT